MGERLNEHTIENVVASRYLRSSTVCKREINMQLLDTSHQGRVIKASAFGNERTCAQLPARCFP